MTLENDLVLKINLPLKMCHYYGCAYHHHHHIHFTFFEKGRNYHTTSKVYKYAFPVIVIPVLKRIVPNRLFVVIVIRTIYIYIT